MDKVGNPRAAIAAVVLTGAMLLAGCAAPRQSAPFDSTGSTNSVGNQAGHLRLASGGVNSGGSSIPAPSVPATWPRDVPIPPGKLLGSTTSTGRWTLLLLETGSAAQVLQSAGAFYKAAGYTPVSASLWNKGTRHITLVVQNRDHSATKTNLAIQLTTP